MAEEDLDLQLDNELEDNNQEDTTPQLNSKVSSAKRESVADSSDKSDEIDETESPKHNKLSLVDTTTDGEETGHDRGKTIFSVTKIIEEGEQPKTDKYEIWAWYCYDC